MQLVSIISIRIGFAAVISTIPRNKCVVLCMLTINYNLFLFHPLLYNVNDEFFPVLRQNIPMFDTNWSKTVPQQIMVSVVLLT